MPHTFTDAQLIDIRRFAGYPIYGLGNVVFPYPWFWSLYLALEYRVGNMTDDEANVVINTYLANLYTLETAIPASSANLDTDSAAVWHHNKYEVRDRERLFTSWRMKLCYFLGLEPGPGLVSSTNRQCVV